MKPIFCILLVVCSSFLYSQTHTITGTVRDQNNQLIETGDVLLLDTTQKLVKSTMLTKGNFIIKKIKAEKYTLIILSSGYQKKTQTIDVNEDFTTKIILEESTVALDEVTIKNSKPNFSIENGNLKVNIENSIFESLSNSIDLLSKLPGIQISPNQESIAIIGKGNPLIYLGNQRIDIEQLKSLSVDNIKSIEIIDNPSAKYEAEGRSLILITRKKRIHDGYQVQISETPSFKRKFSNYALIHTNLKKNKLELRANLSYNHIGFWESVDSKLILPQQNIISEQQTKATGLRPQFVLGSGVFYELNDSDYVSGQFNYRAHTDRFPVITNTAQDINLERDFIISDSQNDAPRSFLSSNLNFNKQLSHNSTMFFGIQYSNYKRDLKSLISNDVNQMGAELFQNRDQQYQINILAAKVDFEKVFNKSLKLEIGGNISQGSAVAFSDFIFLSEVRRLTTLYDYEEGIYSSYGQLSGKIKKVTYTTGVRSEINFVKSGFRNGELAVDRKQHRLFPQIKVNVPIDSTKSFTFNYNTTINRPSYLNASSISTFINPLVEFSRNVNLKPTTTEEVSAVFQYKKNEVNLSYFTTKNPVFFSPKFDSAQNRVITSPQNFSRESGYALQLRNTLSYKPWTSTNSITVTYSKIKDPEALTENTKPYVYYYSNNEFKLPSKTTLGINLWGLTNRYQGIFKRNSIFVLGISLSKTFSEKFQVTLNTNDLFRNMNFKDQYTINNIITEDIFYVNAQEISLALKYSFGKIKKSSFKNKDIDENLNRM